MKRTFEFTVRLPKSDDVSPADVKAYLQDVIRTGDEGRKVPRKMQPVVDLAREAKVLRTYTKKAAYR